MRKHKLAEMVLGITSALYSVPQGRHAVTSTTGCRKQMHLCSRDPNVRVEKQGSGDMDSKEDMGVVRCMN